MLQASAFGSVPLQLTFRGETVAVDRLLLGSPLYLVLVDLMCARSFPVSCCQDPKSSASGCVHRFEMSLHLVHNIPRLAKVLYLARP